MLRRVNASRSSALAVLKPASLLGVACFAALALSGAEMRTWTLEKSGKTLEAQVAGFSDNAVTLKEANGRTVSVPLAYLSKGDRQYLVTERSQQWKEVDVIKLDASTALGRYKKCRVQGEGAASEVYIERLPASVISVLQARNQQAAPVEALAREVEAQKKAVQAAKSGVSATDTKTRANRRQAARERGQVNVEASNVNAREAELARLQKTYDESVAKTRHQTQVKMRNTGAMYKGLPLWQCFEPGKPQP